MLLKFYIVEMFFLVFLLGFFGIDIEHRGGSRGVRRVLEHPSNIHTFTAKNDNCSEAVLKIIKLLLLIMTTALKLC